MCVDYTKINDVTKKDSFPLPRVDDILDTLGGGLCFCALDLVSVYWQVEVHPEGPTRLVSIPHHAVQIMQCPKHISTTNGACASRAPLGIYIAYLDDIVILGSTNCP